MPTNNDIFLPKEKKNEIELREVIEGVVMWRHLVKLGIKKISKDALEKKETDKTMLKINYWLDWTNKIIKPNNEGLNDIPWSEIENYPITVLCDHHTWPYLAKEESEKKLVVDVTKRTIQIGLATIKELRGATEERREGMGSQALKKCFELCPKFVKEHPSHDKETFERISGWVFPPRFENLKEGKFENVWKIDIKNCYGEIMRRYPLPYGQPVHIRDQNLIEQKLEDKEDGFISFRLTSYAKIKDSQIPFVPNLRNEIKPEFKGRLLLHTKLLQAFVKQYKIWGKIVYNDFWVFSHRKGDVNKFLNYCDQLKAKEETKAQGKMLTNAFYGAVGKSNYGSYNYRAWTLAINHLAILQTYYLYRQFKPKQILAIRSDCIYVQGDLPQSILDNQTKYHLEHYNKVSFQGESNIFIHDLGELKSFTSGEEREELIKSFNQQ